MRPLLAMLLLIALAAPDVTPAYAQAAAGWAEYRNEKYGFRLEYPGEIFKVERTTEAGDGQVFASVDGDARLLVGALKNESNFTTSTYQDHVARDSYAKFHVTYRPLGKTWFVLSGEGDGKVFYEKVVFTCSGRLINSFAMIYPVEKRASFDPILERIENTFKGGTDCAQAGLPAAGKKRAAHVPARSRTAAQHGSGFRRAERSAIADRIARERGQDVFVVLQRTSPPYDRKILRGYVSRP